jgi:hypothetical protein
MARKIHLKPKTDDASVAPGMLAHLSDLHDFRIGEAEPDIRGWTVVLPDDRRVGKVDDLIVDTTDMTARYIEMKVDHHVLNTNEDTWVLVPIGAARIDDRGDVVRIDRLPSTGLAGAPRFERGAPTAAQQRAIHEYYAPAEKAASAGDTGLFDDRRFWGKRRSGRQHTPYISRASAQTDMPVVEAIVVEAVVAEPGAGSDGQRSDSGRTSEERPTGGRPPRGSARR